MAGIISFGGYVPIYRLSRNAIARGMPGEKAICGFDEDSITMAVEAGLDCLRGRDRSQVDALIFASTTSPYKEKQAAVTVANALDLRREVLTMDSTNTLRAGTLALGTALDAIKAGSARQVLVVAADCRMGSPRGDLDRASGDGAAAFLLGKDGEAVSVVGSYNLTSDVLDVWRSHADDYVRSWEDRFVITQGYEKVIREAVAGTTKKFNVTPKDFAKAIFYGPDARSHAGITRAMGFDPAQVQNGLFETVGSSGAAHVPMQLVAALETAKAGDKLLVVNYGDGADATILQVTSNISKVKGPRGIKGHLALKKAINDYDTYARWRQLLSLPEDRNPVGGPSAPAVLREQDSVVRLHAGKCKSCGFVNYPPQRVCENCRAKDQWDPWPLAERKGTIFTFTHDYLSSTAAGPTTWTIVDFEGGGRIATAMTDRDMEEVRIGLPVEMTFRQIRFGGGVHNYWWKTRAIRAGS
ncbi:MAG: OB-fold domain-containing protein [Chloroflexi bacterium]|nr:OB-fold domain-containing protein [Chloroflexota bacterium]